LIELKQQLSVEDNNRLTKSFDAIEIKEVVGVCVCGSYKSRELDGFNFSFIKKFWNIINKYILHAVEHFYKFGNIYRGCNASFINLVPKLENLVTLDEYKPISMHIQISKVLSNRMKKVLPKIIDRSQSTFISRRVTG